MRMFADHHLLEGGEWSVAHPCIEDRDWTEIYDAIVTPRLGKALRKL